MFRFRRLTKLANTLNKLFIKSIKLKFSQSLNKIITKNYKHVSQTGKTM
jgi:hypothetical protein